VGVGLLGLGGLELALAVVVQAGGDFLGAALVVEGEEAGEDLGAGFGVGCEALALLGGVKAVPKPYSLVPILVNLLRLGDPRFVGVAGVAA